MDPDEAEPNNSVDQSGLPPTIGRVVKRSGVLEELTWLAECAEAPSRQESELAWFAKHFYRVLTQLPDWADALRVTR